MNFKPLKIIIVLFKSFIFILNIYRSKNTILAIKNMAKIFYDINAEHISLCTLTLTVHVYVCEHIICERERNMTGIFEMLCV